MKDIIIDTRRLGRILGAKMTNAEVDEYLNKDSHYHLETVDRSINGELVYEIVCQQGNQKRRVLAFIYEEEQ